MDTLLKPSVGSREHLFFFGEAFRLAVSVERGRERVLFLRDEAVSDGDGRAGLGASGDVGFKVQRELRQGRDVFVLSGRAERRSEGEVSVVVERADLHVRPEIVEATRSLAERNAAALSDRLMGMAVRAVQETLDRSGRPVRVVSSADAEVGAADMEDRVMTGVTDEDDFIDPDLLELTPISAFF
ncbi:hypothetical protein [Deinococcus ficus]|nr:hypothetical protein [Deinococcus ficus]